MGWAVLGTLAVKLLADAHTYRMAEGIMENVVLPLARSFDEDDLSHGLKSWAANDQCVFAAEMPQYAADLFELTRHLLPDSVPIWVEFLTAVRAQLSEGAGAEYVRHYSYPDLFALVDRARNAMS